VERKLDEVITRLAAIERDVGGLACIVISPH
jgi:hypothetical protein